MSRRRQPISNGKKISDFFSVSNDVQKSVEELPKKENEKFYEKCEIDIKKCKGNCITQRAALRAKILAMNEKKQNRRRN